MTIPARDRYCSSSSGQILPVHELVLAAQEADTPGARPEHRVDLDRQLYIGLKLDDGAVARDRREVPEARQPAALALVFLPPPPVMGERLGGWIDDHPSRRAVDDHRVTATDDAHQAGDAEHGRQAEGAGHDRGVALGTAELRRHARHQARRHERRIGRAQLLGQDDAALGQLRECLVGRVGQAPHEALADLADILHPGGEVDVARPGEVLHDPGDFGLDGGFRVQTIIGDARVDAAHEARIAQHVHVGVEQVAELLGRRIGQDGGLLLELLELLPRAPKRIGEAQALGLPLTLGDVVFGHLEHAALAHMGRADGDAGRYAEAVGQALDGALGGRHGPLPTAPPSTHFHNSVFHTIAFPISSAGGGAPAMPGHRQASPTPRGGGKSDP